MNRITLILFILYLIGFLDRVYAQSAEDILNTIFLFESNQTTSDRMDQYYAEAGFERRSLGLSFAASVQHRFGEGFIEADLTENSGQTYYKTSLQWDILREGFYHNKYKSNQLEILARIEKYEAGQSSKRESYYAQYAFTGYLFDKELINYYQSREVLLRSKRPVYATLREEGYYTNREILELESRMEETGIQIQILTESNESFELIFNEELNQYFHSSSGGIGEMPSVRIHQLLEDMSSSPSLSELGELRKESIQQPGFWTRDVNLRASLSYNHQVSFIDTRRDFVSMGLSLTVPLSANRSYKNQSYVAEQKEIDSKYALELKNRKKELLMLYQEYSYKQKQRTNTQSTLEILSEKLRALHLEKISVNKELPVTDASLLQDDLIAVQIEHVSLARQMMQLLLKMNLLLLDTNITDYLIYSEDNPIADTKKEAK